MAARSSNAKRSAKASQAPEEKPVKSRRGRKIPTAEVRKRIEIYDRQEAEGFTNAEAAEMLDMGLPAWNQWKQKYRRTLGPAAGPIQRGRRSSLPLPPQRPIASQGPASAADINSQAEAIRLRSKLAEAETFISALKELLDQYQPNG